MLRSWSRVGKLGPHIGEFGLMSLCVSVKPQHRGLHCVVSILNLGDENIFEKSLF